MQTARQRRNKRRREAIALTRRWTKLRYHAEQRKYWLSEARFIVNPSGRRSGKSEIAKRKAVKRIVTFTSYPDGRFAFCAPTFPQAHDIFWTDLKALIPPELIRNINETRLTITLFNGAKAFIQGLDKPQRLDGPPLDGAVVDEIAETKKQTWQNHIRPALDTDNREGWAILIGRPKGRNHYYKMAQFAQNPENVDWEYFHWFSSTVLRPAIIAAAKAELDPRSFAQEYEGQFVDFAGRAYYEFFIASHACERVLYNPDLPLILCFDFNVAPGVVAVAQEQKYKGTRKDVVAEDITAWVGEVYIPTGSNTPMICRKISHDWKHHKGRVLCYGDSTGGSKHTSQTEGSDWDIIKAYLKNTFGDKLDFKYPKANPTQKSRVNAVNSRVKTADGKIHMLVDPENCPHLIEDLEGTTIVEGSAGEINKKDLERSHITDAAGYYIAKEFPITDTEDISVEELVF